MLGATPIAVVSSAEKGEMARKFGAVGTLNRKEFPGLAYTPNETPEQKKARIDATKTFGKAFMKAAGTNKGPDVVFEHPGQETFPTSVFVAAQDGAHRHLRARRRASISPSTCGTSGCARSQIIGSHFAHAEECWRANDLVLKGTIKPMHDRGLLATRTSPGRTTT